MKTWKLFLTCLLLSVCLSRGAFAFVISSQLAGDFRPENPDNLLVNVTITVDETGPGALTMAQWLIDLDSPLHPDMKLGSFFFNLADDSKFAFANLNFFNFSPSNWAVQAPAINAQGSGSADFEFKALDPPGQPNVNVTNSQSLTFGMELLSGSFNPNDFLLADFSTSSDSPLGSFQLGAHLQSLAAGPGQSDSGFAVGSYQGSPQPVPEPGTLLLLGAGLVGLGIYGRRRKKG